jgi:hypothetical protein
VDSKGVIIASKNNKVPEKDRIMQDSVKVQVKLIMDADIDSMKMMARDIDQLCDLVPEWNGMEADQIKDRIGRRMKKWIKAKQVNA